MSGFQLCGSFCALLHESRLKTFLRAARRAAARVGTAHAGGQVGRGNEELGIKKGVHRKLQEGSCQRLDGTPSVLEKSREAEIPKRNISTGSESLWSQTLATRLLLPARFSAAEFLGQPEQQLALIERACPADLDQQFVKFWPLQGEIGRTFIADRANCAKVMRLVNCAHAFVDQMA